MIARQPPGPDRAALERTLAFATFAAQNLTLSKTVLSTISQPIAVHSTLLHGRRTPLNTFAVVVAVSVSLMFVCVLLAAGGVALEREEHALARACSAGWSPARRCSPRRCCSPPPARSCSRFAMLAGIGAFVHARLDARAAVAGRARLRRARVRRARRRDRRARARGARRLAARLPALAAARLPRARPRRVGGRRPLRRDLRGLVRVPLQGRAAGARRGRQPVLARLCRSRSCTCRPRRVAVRRARARSGLRRARMDARAGRRLYLGGRWPFPKRACAACAPPPRCAGSCARPSCAPASSCCRCSSPRRDPARRARADRDDARRRAPVDLRRARGGPRGRRARASPA